MMIMQQKITCAINTTDNQILQQITDRILLSGIIANNIKPASKCIYFDAVWDDADIPTIIQKPNHNKAGAKPKKLVYEGAEATCGLVWKLRNEGHLSDAEIGLILDVSESTIARRRKKHLSDGSFHSDSKVMF